MLSSNFTKRFQRDSKGFLRNTLETPEAIHKAALSSAQSLLRTSDPSLSHGSLQGYTIEDIAQEACIKILAPSSHPNVNTAYVTATVKSVLVDTAKKAQVPLEFPQVLPENTKEFYDLMSLEDIAEDILRFLHGGQKELFTAVYVEGIPLEDLSTHYGLTERTINRKLHELRLRLANLLELEP